MKYECKHYTQIKVKKYKDPNKDGNQLVGFLREDEKRSDNLYLFEDAQEVTCEENQLVCNHNNSLSLLTYAALNRKEIYLGSSFESRIDINQIDSKVIEKSEAFFSGKNIKLPKNTALDSKYRSFEEWSSTKETTHISPWIYAAFQGIFGEETVGTTELHIPLPGEKRPARLDVVTLIKSKNCLFIFEAKTSIQSAQEEARFTEQVPRYSQASKETLRCFPGFSSETILIVGGNENDHLPSSSNGSISPSNAGKDFLKKCSDNNVKFVTANALWQLLVLNIISNGSGDFVLKTFTELSENYQGLTSAGFISKSNYKINTL